MNTNEHEKIKQDGVARASTLSKQAMQAEIARVLRKAWLDKVAPLIGLPKQARVVVVEIVK